MPTVKIPAVFMRGGTSRGVFFRGDDLPTDPTIRDQVLQRVLGSPDPYGRQIDGLGGATSSTSKAAIIAPSARPDSDVDYTIAQIPLDDTPVDYSANCGNLASAVGPFAIETGQVSPQGDETTIRIWQVNTQRRIIARVPTRDGLPVEEGNFAIDGIALPGAEISLDFLDPAGTSTGALLPTGRTTDILEIPGFGPITVTLLDAALATVFIRAADVGLTGTELKPAIDGNAEKLALLEAIRIEASIAFGLAATRAEAAASPATPKVAFVGPPQRYTAADGRVIETDAIDFVARILSMGALHHAYEVSGAIATAAAAAIPGTIVSEVAGQPFAKQRTSRIGHVSGTLAVGTTLTPAADGWALERATLSRTARRLMEGQVCVPAACLS